MKKIKLKSLIVFVCGLCFSLLLGLGFFGEGIDVVYSYNRGETNIWKPSEFIGGIFATLTINGVYLGVYLVAGFIFYSLVNFYSSELKTKTFTFLLIIVLFMLSWPLYLGSTNALRQGVTMAAFINILAIIKYHRQSINYLHIGIFSVILIFSHGYGLLIAANFVLFFILNKKFRLSNFNIGWIGGVILIAFNSIRDFVEYQSEPTGLDARYPIILMTVVAIILYTIFFSETKKLFLRVALYFILSIFLFSLIFIDDSLVFERLMWIPVLIVLLVFPDFVGRVNLKPLTKFIMFSVYVTYATLSLYTIGFNFY